MRAPTLPEWRRSPPTDRGAYPAAGRGCPGTRQPFRAQPARAANGHCMAASNERGRLPTVGGSPMATRAVCWSAPRTTEIGGQICLLGVPTPQQGDPRHHDGGCRQRSGGPPPTRAPSNGHTLARRREDSTRAGVSRARAPGRCAGRRAALRRPVADTALCWWRLPGGRRTCHVLGKKNASAVTDVGHRKIRQQAEKGCYFKTCRGAPAPPQRQRGGSRRSRAAAAATRP